MAKLQSPLFSIDAHGKLGRELQIDRRRRGPVAGRRRRPTQPRTEPQRATRLWQSFLATQWQLHSASERTSWSAYEPANNLPSYHSYISYNVRQLHSFPGTPQLVNPTLNCPATTWPPARNTSAASHAPIAPVPGIASATFGVSITTAYDNWLILWFHTVTGGPWALYKNLIGATPATAPGNYYLTVAAPSGISYTCGYLCVSRTGKPRLNMVFRATTPL